MKKEEIVSRCRSILIKESAIPLTIDEIANYLKCSKKTIYKNFESKKYLYISVFEFYIEESKKQLIHEHVLQTNNDLSFSPVLRKVHNSIRGITKSRLFHEIGNDNLFLEMYYYFKSIVLNEYLNKSIQKSLIIKNVSRCELMAKFLLENIEARYFGIRYFNAEEDYIYIEQLEQMYLVNINYLNGSLSSV